jgi:hypothetical protein
VSICFQIFILCKTCLRTFSIHEGKPALRKHMKSFENNASITHTSFSETQKVSAMVRILYLS